MQENNQSPVKTCDGCKKHSSVNSEALYGLGVIGAAVYFVQHATSFTTVALGLIKAVAWPAVIIYQVLTLLKL